MSIKPTVIFVPGAWHSVEAYGLLRQALENRGYPVISISLPSGASEPPIVSLGPDISAIRTAVKSVVDKGGEVVLIMHSYGSVPGVESTEGLGKEDREEQGEKGGIIKLIFMAGFILHEGGSLFKGLEGKDLPWWAIEGDLIRPINPGYTFYNGLTPSEQEFWSSKLLEHQPYPLIRCEVTHEGWRKIASTYIVYKNDKALPPVAQRAMIESTGGGSGC